MAFWQRKGKLLYRKVNTRTKQLPTTIFLNLLSNLCWQFVSSAATSFFSTGQISHRRGCCRTVSPFKGTECQPRNYFVNYVRSASRLQATKLVNFRSDASIERPILHSCNVRLSVMFVYCCIEMSFLKLFHRLVSTLCSLFHPYQTLWQYSDQGV